MVNASPAERAKLTALLAAVGIEDAALEVQWILEDAADFVQACGIAQRRAKREPLQYLLGAWEFYGLRMAVGEGVLIPRADTEILVETVLTALRETPSPKILDLCTGSGCIALALKSQRQDAAVSGIDLSAAALRYAKKNAAYHHFQVDFIEGDVCAEEVFARFSQMDVITCNPPYLTGADMKNLQAEVRYEPEAALYGGEDGLSFYRRIAPLWRSALKPNGMLAFEVGIGQAEAVRAIMAQAGYTETAVTADLNGIARVVTGYSR